METACSLLCLDERIGIKISFVLGEIFTVPALIRAKGSELRKSFEEAMSQLEGKEQAIAAGAGDKQKAGGGSKVAPRLPSAFGHAFATHFQFRYRHSPKPNSVPWSAWCNGADTGLQCATADHGIQQTKYMVEMNMSGDQSLQYGSHYQVSVRLSDGTCWSPWSEPSAPVKVFVAPPSLQSASESVQVHSIKDSNIRLKWPLLKAHSGLSLIEYGLFIREVLHDGTELCPRQQAALVQGRSKETGVTGPIKSTKKNQKVQVAPGVEYFKEGDKEMMTCEVRDLRKDVTYIFSLGVRYPYIGTRSFEDSLHSSHISLGSVGTKMPVPIQVYMPEARLRRFQGSKVVLLRWSFTGINEGPGAEEKVQENLDALIQEHERRYELQALGEDLDQTQWHTCTNLSRMKVDGMTCWAVKDLPFKTLRGRFRLWDKDAGRFGRSSPVILTQMEPVQKLSIVRVISPSYVSLVLRTPLNATKGTQQYACRYQIRMKLASAGDDSWTELPVNMLWHQQNDHLQNDDDLPTEPLGAISHGLENVDYQGDVTFGRGAAKVAFPSIPLATVGACGAVTRQRCLVVTVREEDGIDIDKLYVFSARIGDLYRLSEWSEPSVPIRLAVPPPLLDPKLGTRMAQLKITDLTGNKANVYWPQFLPAINGSVPIETEVEYLLTVTPQTSNSKYQSQKPSAAPHCQILQTAALDSGATTADLGEMTAEVVGLSANTPYEFKLSVRYTALGTRQWTTALQTNITTNKDEDRFAVEICASVPNVKNGNSGSAHEQMEMTYKRTTVPLEAGARVDLDVRPHTSMSSNSPRPGSLPVMESRPAVPNRLDTSSPEPPRPASAQEFEEWALGVQREAEKVTGGALLECLHLEGTARRNRDRTPQKPPGADSFWSRDQGAHRPQMPVMPSMGRKYIVSPEPTTSSEAVLPSAAVPAKPPTGRSLSSRGRYIRGGDEQNFYPRRTAR